MYPSAAPLTSNYQRDTVSLVPDIGQGTARASLTNLRFF